MLGLAIGYTVVLVVATPPNNWDSLWYNLSRAALWHQHHGVRYVEPVSTELVNAYPPNAEIGVLYTFTFLSRDTLAAGVQLCALLGSIVAVFGLARRLGYAGRAALLAAFVFASLPLVALQAGTTQNDLVTASFIAVAAFFSFGRTRIELVLAGLAVGLAVGTKFTALLALPALALVVVAAQPLRRVPAAFAAWLPGIALLGSYAYIQNLIEKGHLLGFHAGLAEIATSGKSSETLVSRASTAGRLLYRFFDLSGLEAIGQRGYAVLILAVVFVGAVLVEARSPSRRARVATLAVGLLALSPLLLPQLAELAGHAYQGTVRAAGRPEWAYTELVRALVRPRPRDQRAGERGLGVFRPPRCPASGPGCGRQADRVAPGPGRQRVHGTRSRPPAVHRRRGPDNALGQLARTVPDHPDRAPRAADCSASPLELRRLGRGRRRRGDALPEPVRERAEALRDTGRRLHGSERFLPIDKGFSVWGAPRAVVQSIARPELRPVLTVVARLVPDNASVGLAVNSDEWIYPFFGATLSRRVSFLVAPVRLDRIPANGPDWVIAAPDQLSTVCAANWRPRPIGDTGWTILEREPGADSCVVQKGT